MAHEFETGFFVRQPAWHGLGQVIGEYPGSWDEARKLAGLDWEPISELVYALAGIQDDGEDRFESVEGWQRIARSDTGKTLSLNKDSYTLISHKEMGEIVEAILDQANVKYETAGCLDEGRKVWCLVKLDEPTTIPGDFSPTYPYLAMLNRHDGGGSCKAMETNVRVVCANTFSMADAQGERDGNVYSFRHTKGWHDRIDEARQVISGVRKEHREWVALATELIGIKVTQRQADQFIAEFIPMPPEMVISDRVAKNVEEARSALRGALYSPTTAPVADTVYGLVQAAGEYLDHIRGYRSKDTYLGRQLLRPEPLKARAVKLAREVVTV